MRSRRRRIYCGGCTAGRVASGAQRLGWHEREGLRGLRLSGDSHHERRHRLGVIAALVREIPGTLNMLAGPGSPSVAELARLGVRRVTVGSGPARAAMGLTRRIGRELLQSGTYSSLGGDALPYAEANALFEGDNRAEPPEGS